MKRNRSQETLWVREQNKLINKALEKFQGNRTKACEHLGISVRTIRNRIRSAESLSKWKRKDEDIRPSDYYGRYYNYYCAINREGE